MRNLLFVAVTLTAVALTGAHQQHKPPIEKKLAGYSLDMSGSEAFRDERTGYYLVRTGE